VPGLADVGGRTSSRNLLPLREKRRGSSGPMASSVTVGDPDPDPDPDPGPDPGPGPGPNPDPGPGPNPDPGPGTSGMQGYCLRSAAGLLTALNCSASSSWSPGCSSSSFARSAW